MKNVGSEITTFIDLSGGYSQRSILQAKLFFWNFAVSFFPILDLLLEKEFDLHCHGSMFFLRNKLQLSLNR